MYLIDTTSLFVLFTFKNIPITYVANFNIASTCVIVITQLV